MTIHSAQLGAGAPAPLHLARTPPASGLQRASLRFVAGLLASMVVAPGLVWAAFSAHEPHCAEAEAFWNGDRPAGEGPVEGVILGSSRMGFGLDTVQLADATGHAWQRVARHAIVTASVPASYPWMLATTDASPGAAGGRMGPRRPRFGGGVAEGGGPPSAPESSRVTLRALVVEVSPLMMDATSCGRPVLPNVPVEAHWWGPAREALGPDAAIAPAVAMGWLPHRWVMTSGRRHDILEHVKKPAHALALLTDLPGVLHGFEAPARWHGPEVPDLDDARIRSRREFLLGGSLDTFVPHPNVACLATLRETIAMGRAQQTVLVMPPLRARMRDSLPAPYREELRAAVSALAADAPFPTRFLDATDRFADAEDASFTDFDHLSADGAQVWTRELAAILRDGS